jgi:threonine/homoserine/homoserine lactone efflux protein
MDLVSALVFAFVASITPGPNNVMVAAASANHGLPATLPHVFGIAIGFGVMTLLVGLGLAEPLAVYPGLHTALRWAGAAWLLLLAWKIAQAGQPGAAKAEKRPPLGLVGAALFQWINPKAWLMVLAAVTAFTTRNGNLFREVSVLALLFLIVCLPCVLVWAMLGAGTGRFLATPRRLRVFNITMGLLLAGCVVQVLVAE